MNQDLTEGRRVFKLVWARYRQIREHLGHLRVSQKRESSSPEGTQYDLSGCRFLVDVDRAWAAAIRHGLPELAERRREIWLLCYLLEWPHARAMQTIGVSIRWGWELRAELEELVGLELWVRRFCGTVEGARGFEPALAYFGIKDGILPPQGVLSTKGSQQST